MLLNKNFYQYRFKISSNDVSVALLISLGLSVFFLISSVLLVSEEVQICFLVALMSIVLHARKTFLIRLYIFFLGVVFVAPTVGKWFIGDWSTQYVLFSYNDALSYIILYFGVFSVSYVLLTSRSAGQRLFLGLGASGAAYRAGVIVTLVSLSATAYLAYIGDFRALEESTGGSAFDGIIKMLSETRLIALIILGSVTLQSSSAQHWLTYICVAAIFLVLGVYSGSRWYFINVIMIMLLIEWTRNRGFTFLISLIFLPVMAVSFPVLALYRSEIYDLALALQLVSWDGSLPFLILDSLLGDRLNYVSVVQRILDASQNLDELRSDYLDNILGLIPRAVWPSKPLIGMNLNDIGLELGILSVGDFNTSIGLSVIGESYYQLRQYGIVVAVFQAILFRFIESFRYKKQLIWRASYIPLCFLVVVKDSYIYIVPLLITQFLVIYSVAVIARKWKWG